MKKVQFKKDETRFGLSKATGFVWVNQEGIFFEYQVSDNILEIYKSKIKEVSIPFDQVASVIYKKNLLGRGKIVIELSSLKNVDRLPFLEETKICISLKRNQKVNGQEFVSNATYELGNYRFNQV